jgi:hypothetical protein
MYMGSHIAKYEAASLVYSCPLQPPSSKCQLFPNHFPHAPCYVCRYLLWAKRVVDELTLLVSVVEHLIALSSGFPSSMAGYSIAPTKLQNLSQCQDSERRGLPNHC